MADTFEDLHGYLGMMIKEPYGTYNKFPQAERELMINRGVQKVGELLECCKQTDDVSSISGTATYSLTTGSITKHIIDIDPEKEVRYDKVRLNKLTKAELDAFDYNWSNVASGTPSHYVYNRFSKELMLYPPPSTSSTNGIEVNYYYRPTTLTATTDEPEIPQEYRFASCLYAAWHLWRKRGKFAQAKQFKDDFYEEIKIGKSQIYPYKRGNFQMKSYIDNDSKRTGQDLYGNQK